MLPLTILIFTSVFTGEFVSAATNVGDFKRHLVMKKTWKPTETTRQYS